MKTKLITSLGFYLLFTPLFSQEKLSKKTTPFDLNTYKYRFQDYAYRGLTGYLDGNSETNFSNTNTPVGIERKLNLNGTYFGGRYFNHQDLIFQKNTNSGLNMNSGYFNSSGNRSNIGAYHNYNQSKYKYNKTNPEKFNFQSLSTLASWQGATYRNSQSETKNSWLNIGAEWSIGNGKGRLEYISDAAFANFFFEALKQEKLIENYSAAQVEALAQKYTEIRNKRVLDYRNRFKYQYKELLNFSKSQGFDVSNSDFLTVMTDHFLFANNFGRFTGRRFVKGINFSTSHSFSNSKEFNRNTIVKSKSDNISLDLPVSIFANWESHRAVNLYLNKFFNLEASIGNRFSASSAYSKSTDVADNVVNYYNLQFKDDDKMLNPFVSLELEKGIDIYPNTRNFLRFSISDEFSANYTNISKVIDKRAFNLFATNFEFYSWLGPQLQFSGKASIQSNFYLYHQNNLNVPNPNGNLKTRRTDLSTPISFSVNYYFY